MVLGGADEFVEIFKGAIPYYVIVFLPIFIILSPLDPVLGAREFTLYRAQQYDLQGTTYGCRSAAVNAEARTIKSDVYIRRGVMARITELKSSKYRDIINQGAAGLVILIPENFSTLSNLYKEHILELESTILEEETSVPVYFAVETPALLEIYYEVENSAATDHKTSGAEAIFDSVIGNGFQLVIGSSQPKALSDVQVANIWGKLIGHGIEEQLPSIVITAHYDAFGVAPALSYGADSNGSGVAALLELMRLFSRLYSNPQTHARYNLLFLLSGGGKFNYLGTKKWIEDNLEVTDGGLLQDAIYTLCIDSIGHGDELYFHVSKPPKDGSAGAYLLKSFKTISELSKPKVNFDMVHKKINLADDVLAFEHERFSIRRLPAFTVSHFQSAKASNRNTILDERSNVDLKKLNRNVRIIAEALAHQIYNISDEETIDIFSGTLKVQEESIAGWIDFLTSQPRGAQLLVNNGKSQLVNTLENAMDEYLSEVKVTYVKPDKRDPEFAFYDLTAVKMNAHSVKPAVFDLFLSLTIIVYLIIIYFALQHFSWLVFVLKKVTGQMKMKQI
ncbi:hypothetical protein CHUAL_011083 [Chamberlinius hualienensis]